jgi:hypothetical protein
LAVIGDERYVEAESNARARSRIGGWRLTLATAIALDHQLHRPSRTPTDITA